MLAIRSPFRETVNVLEGPGEGVGDQGDELVEGATKGGWLPAPAMIGDVQEPDMDAVAGETQVFVRVVLGSGFDDDGGAVPPGAEVAEVAGVKQALYGFGVGVFSLLLGHRWARPARLAADS